MTPEQGVLSNYIESLISHIMDNRELIESDKHLDKSNDIIQSLILIQDNLENGNVNTNSVKIKKLYNEWDKIYKKHC